MGALIEKRDQYRDFQDRYSLFQAATALFPLLTVNAILHLVLTSCQDYLLLKLIKTIVSFVYWQKFKIV